MGCDILSILSPKQLFADSVAKQDSLWRLLWVLERPDGSADDASTDASSRLQRGWSLLESLSSSSSIASKMVHSSGWMELLGIIAGYESFTKLFASRMGSAKTLSRLLWDENTGPVAGKCVSSIAADCDLAFSDAVPSFTLQNHSFNDSFRRHLESYSRKKDPKRC